MSGRGRRDPVLLDVADTTVRLALAYACDEAGWPRTPRMAPGVLVVADRVDAGGDGPPLDVLVVGPTPLACRRAMEAVAVGAARALVPANSPRTLPRTLRLAEEGFGLVPHQVLEAAQRFPALAPRHERLLQLLLRGCSTPVLARSLQVSQATVKRDLSQLLRVFDAPDRVALAATAARLGVRAA